MIELSANAFRPTALVPAGTRLYAVGDIHGRKDLLDRLLGAARPEGYWNQPKSHNAVAAAIAQGRADWGMTIAPVAHAGGLGFIPLTDEHYDFALVTARKHRPAVRAFLQALASEGSRAALTSAGFRKV